VRRLAAACALLLGAASCATPRNGLNTPSASCFRALPAAEAAVRRKGALVGVRRVSKAELSAKLPQASAIEAQTLCAIAFRAGYQPGDVVDANPAGPGGFALVVLDSGGAKVLGSFVLDALPVRFHHRA